MEKPCGASTACVACTWHGINIWGRFSWDLIETIPRFYPLMESIKFCGLTSVPVVRVCGCGSECVLVGTGCGFSPGALAGLGRKGERVPNLP